MKQPSLLDELQKYWPQAKMMSVNFRDEDGRIGPPVPYSQLDAVSGWLSPGAAQRRLLVAKVQARRAGRE